MKRKLSALDSPTATGEDGSRRSNAVPRTEAAPATVIPAAMSEHQAQDSQSQPGGPESTTPPSDVPAKRESETLGEDSIASAPPEPTVTLPAAPVTAEDGQFGIFEVDVSYSFCFMWGFTAHDSGNMESFDMPLLTATSPIRMTLMATAHTGTRLNRKCTQLELCKELSLRSGC